MAIVIIESPSLTSDQKTRIGERVITALPVSYTHLTLPTSDLV